MSELSIFAPKSYEELDWIAQRLARTQMIPKAYQGKPEDCFAAIIMGAELGVSAMQSLQGIAVINGRPSVWGDLLIAICRAHESCESIHEGSEVDEKGGVFLWWCKAKRKGNPEQTRSFSRDDAVKAGLWGKGGPWSQYPSRMLQMRARAFCLRDVFSDALKGIASADEQIDISADDAPAPRGTTTATAQPEPKKDLPALPSKQELDPEAFAQKLNVWAETVKRGTSKTEPGAPMVAQLLASMPQKYAFTDDQIAQIKALHVETESSEIIEGEVL